MFMASTKSSTLAEKAKSCAADTQEHDFGKQSIEIREEVGQGVTEGKTVGVAGFNETSSFRNPKEVLSARLTFLALH